MLELPVLEIAPPAPREPRRPLQAGAAVDEFSTDHQVLPRFHVWTLGCQMNVSDSEEMAGALLAAGCAEAPSLEEAELIVINTCAIRETAEQKVIGRMGVLGRLKEANPRTRVVLTGCAVRADNEASLARRYPAVDLFLRPDQEPELTAHLGLAGATAPGPMADASFARVGRSVAGGRRPPAGHSRRRGRRGSGRARIRHARLAPDHLRLRQDLHLLHRAVQPGTGAQPAVRRRARGGARPRGRRLSRGHAARPERELMGP